MISHSQMREYIIKPTLEPLGLYSPASEELLIATMANESCGGLYLDQLHGPALGVYQMEPKTHESLWENNLSRHQILVDVMLEHLNLRKRPIANEMVGNLFYATFMARIFYLEKSGHLPERKDLEGIYDYYKKYWNTALGAATKDVFIKNYKNFTQSA